MATVHIRFGGLMGGGAPVYAPTPSSAQTITSSATSQQSTAVAQAGDYVTVDASGGAVLVAIGQNPTAASSVGDMVQATKDFGPLKAGDKVAIIDA